MRRPGDGRTDKRKVAAVFGASSGMGRATALALAEHGAAVAVSARRSDPLDDLVKTISADGRAAAAFPADVRDPSMARAAVDRMVAEFGRIDILVYATGTNIPERALEVLSPADWDMMHSTNITGLYHVVQAALPALREANARVVAVSSAAVQMPDVSGVAYQSTKHAMAGFIHGLMK